MPSLLPTQNEPIIDLKTGLVTRVWYNFFVALFKEVLMPSITVVLFEAKAAENSQTTQYTSTNVVTIIDKFTAHNYSAGAVTLAVNLVPSGGAAATSNRVVNYTLAANETYNFPELVGHDLKAGDFISTLASAATSVSIRASGRQIT